MKYLLIILLVSGLSLNQLWAQNYPTGARSSGMGNASVMLSDVWSGYNNQAGLGNIETTQLGFHFENKFAIPEYSLQSFSGAFPVQSGTFGLNLSYFGYGQYNESKIGLGFGKKLAEHFSLGIQLDYLNTYISNMYGNHGAVTGEIGFIAEPIENLFIGGHLFNPTKAKIAEYNSERIPTLFRIGMGYNFRDKAFLAIETEKDIDYNPVFKAGLEFRLIEKLMLRAGISTNPVQNSFGITYSLGKFKVDIAFATHRELGMIPFVSVGYDFGKKE
ncbi:MAG: hypothetical protein A2W91_19005 [Bacteroidetes bacterium GWF2_38_335]|nr:MAG: hypothetical protein A2W91_19005 [Bacteroidetes bacterium GWF2_38_335]OFY80238.1 MAG: hypothetical protein A2281_17190 [Bacteroidetes bacterium RIFOXYA12_FULL_38_20]HBS88733.1 hypothetical protein [Bacteroidales bacterium]